MGRKRNMLPSGLPFTVLITIYIKNNLELFDFRVITQRHYTLQGCGLTGLGCAACAHHFSFIKKITFYIDHWMVGVADIGHWRTQKYNS